MRVFGREPAVLVETLVAVALGVLLTINPDPTVLAAANAVVVAAGGLLTSLFVNAEKALPALVGLIKAAFALMLCLGATLPVNLETGIIAVVSAIAAFYVRQQVYAPVPPPKVVDGRVLSVRDRTT